MMRGENKKEIRNIWTVTAHKIKEIFRKGGRINQSYVFIIYDTRLLSYKKINLGVLNNLLVGHY